MPVESEISRLSGVMACFSGKRILVIGDLMLDEFIWGKVSRISPEAPVPIVNVTGESYYPGGAANVARNVCQFTCGAAVMGLVGMDPQGGRLMELMQDAGIDTSTVQRDASLPTTVKTRIIARNQQVVRVDRERKSPLTAEQTAFAIQRLDGLIASLDGIIVADYGKGFLTQPLADHICGQARAHGKVLTVDPHPHTLLSWQGATAIKPNRAEAFIAAGDALPALPARSRDAVDVSWAEPWIISFFLSPHSTTSASLLFLNRQLTHGVVTLRLVAANIALDLAERGAPASASRVNYARRSNHPGMPLFFSSLVILPTSLHDAVRWQLDVRTHEPAYTHL